MKKLSNHELGELGNLLADLQNRINDYRHIIDLIPDNVVHSISDAFVSVIEEENKREEK